MTIEDSVVIDISAKVQYLCNLLCGEVLCRLDNFFVKEGSTTTTHLKHIMLGLGTYFSPISELSKQKCAMRHRMRKPHELKVR